MAIPAHIEDFRTMATAISAGELTSEAITAACAVELRDVHCVTPEVREFQGLPNAGPFSIVSLRVRLDSRAPAVLTLTPRAHVRFYQTDLARHFRFEDDLVAIDPRVPPEGTVSYRVRTDRRILVFEFTRRSRVLRKLQITARR